MPVTAATPRDRSYRLEPPFLSLDARRRTLWLTRMPPWVHLSRSIAPAAQTQFFFICQTRWGVYSPVGGPGDQVASAWATGSAAADPANRTRPRMRRATRRDDRARRVRGETSWGTPDPVSPGGSFPSPVRSDRDRTFGPCAGRSIAPISRAGRSSSGVRRPADRRPGPCRRPPAGDPARPARPPGRPGPRAGSAARSTAWARFSARARACSSAIRSRTTKKSLSGCTMASSA